MRSNNRRAWISTTFGVGGIHGQSRDRKPRRHHRGRGRALGITRWLSFRFSGGARAQTSCSLDSIQRNGRPFGEQLERMSARHESVSTSSRKPPRLGDERRHSNSKRRRRAQRAATLEQEASAACENALRRMARLLMSQLNERHVRTARRQTPAQGAGGAAADAEEILQRLAGCNR